MQGLKNPQPSPPQSTDHEATGGPAPDEAIGQPYSGDADVFDMVWRFFCSTRLALILILVIAAGSLAGTLLLQIPAGMDPVDYAQWMAQPREKYGVTIANALSAMQLFDVFNSLWFRLLLAGLTMNIIVCTVNRWTGLWKSIVKPRVRMGDGFFKKASHSVVVSADRGDVGETGEALGAALSQARYRVLVERDETKVYLYADKNRYGKFGTVFNHISLVLILAGAIAGGILGFRDREFMIPVGFERPVKHATNLSVRVDQFIDEYYPEGPPKDFRSDAVLFDNGTEVKRYTIRVNDPMEYQGIRFYQAFFGPAAILEVKDASGNVVYSDGVPLAYRSNERPLGIVTLPDAGLELWLLAPVSGKTDPQIPAGQMRVQVFRSGTRVPQTVDNLAMGKPKQIGDFEYTFHREIQFTGLQVAKDPGTALIWIASALMVLGLAMVFYFPHRRVWMVCRPDPNKRTQVLIGGTARRDMGFDDEFRRVVRTVEDATTKAS